MSKIHIPFLQGQQHSIQFLHEREKVNVDLYSHKIVSVILVNVSMVGKCCQELMNGPRAEKHHFTAITSPWCYQTHSHADLTEKHNS